MATLRNTTNADGGRESATESVRLSLRMLRLYQMCDGGSGRLIFLMVIFSPWAFGTTQPWSIETMNTLGYALGVLLGIKLAIRTFTGYRNPRWDLPTLAPGEHPGRNTRRARLLTRVLAALTFFIVAWCFTSAFNARSAYMPADRRFEFYPHFIAWLPHSYDQQSSWRAFYNYLALGLFFWALRDWVVGKSLTEERSERGQLGDTAGSGALLPERLRHLLWVLSINGGLLALEGIIQRVDGTGKLLFFQPTRINREAISQFGPYAYRSNATQYFNLVWPVCLGFWWTMQRAAKTGLRTARHWLGGRQNYILICVLLMAVCPLVAASRAGAFVAVMDLVAAAAVLWSAQEKGDLKAKVGILAFLGLILVCGALLGWAKLAPRLEPEAVQEGLNGRNTMYDIARPMADDYPLFGTGPGTFEALFQIYRVDPEEYWPAQLHNDWLETRITFGWLGSAMIALAMGLVLIRWFVPGGIHGGTRLVWLCWVAITGCLVHARYDFPFQIYSIVFVFLLICAILSTLSRRVAC